MSRVFVVQNQLHRVDAELVPKFDFESAKEFGPIHYLLNPSAKPFHPEHVIYDLQQKLRDFSLTDYLLLIGNPALIGFAVAIAAQRNRGRVNLLQWSSGKYVLISADLGEPPGIAEWRKTWLNEES